MANPKQKKKAKVEDEKVPLATNNDSVSDDDEVRDAEENMDETSTDDNGEANE